MPSIWEGSLQPCSECFIAAGQSERLVSTKQLYYRGTVHLTFITVGDFALLDAASKQVHVGGLVTFEMLQNSY